MTFDPTAHLINLKGKAYLQVMHRLAWFRDVHPDGVITTELIHVDADQAIVKATVTVPGGGMATGYGSETRADFPDPLEKAETKAVGRALAMLGYGTQFAIELDMDNPDGSPHVVDAPAPPRTPAPPARPYRPRTPAGPPPGRPPSPWVGTQPPDEAGSRRGDGSS